MHTNGFIENCRREIERSKQAEAAFAQLTATEVERLYQRLTDYRATEAKYRASVEQHITEEEARVKPVETQLQLEAAE